MVARVQSAATAGVDAVPVEVEVNEGKGTFSMVVVGLPDTAVKESRDRVKTAVENSGFKPPWGKITINLAPADLKKEGPSFDLPIALGMLAACRQLESPRLLDYSVCGELALNGAVREVRGALPLAMEARKRGLRGIVLPAGNALEAAVVEGIEAIPVRSLREAVEWFSGKREIEPARADLEALFRQKGATELDFSEVKGQQSIKRALEVAAAGGHNILMIGPPGSGKSMLAKRLAGILPKLSIEEAIETTKIHSVAGLLGGGRPFLTTRPFRSPHHTISDVGLVGGGTNPSPGEISLAHHGVLFLDELPEFKRSALEAMRQPIEDGRVTVSRAAGSVTFPARIMLVAAMNPTPDGKALGQSRSTPNEIRKYLGRVSGPLLDRIDMHVEVEAVPISDLGGKSQAESSATIRERVERACERQRERFKASGLNPARNAAMGSKEIRIWCALNNSCQAMLESAMSERMMSARAYDRILKVALTIADLEGVDSIGEEHLLEAIQFRSLDKQLWG